MSTPHESLTTEPAASTSPEQKIRLRFLDGLRGLAALYVLISHTVGQVQEGLLSTGRQPAVWFRLLRLPLEWGPDAVGVFIVLSGFCLMLPVVRSEDGRLRGGLLEFFRRRSLRILPAYYAACVLGVAWLVLDAYVDAHGPISFSDALGRSGLTPGVLLSHLFLVHDLRPEWIYGIESPLWSIAIEWHIYFIFALILLPLWRRWGLGPCVVLAVVVGSGPHWLLKSPYNVDWTHPYMLGLFAMGMAGAVICFSTDAKYIRVRDLPWGRVFWSMVFVTYILVAWVLHKRPDFDIMTPLVGLTATSLILWCVQSLRTEAKSGGNVILRLLESRVAVGVGAFSYSLYLIHGLIVVHVKSVMQQTSNLPVFYAGTIVLCLGLSIGAAYVLYLVFERPFLKMKDRG